MKIFLVNAGSSSLKYQLFDMDDNLSLLKVIVRELEWRTLS